MSRPLVTLRGKATFTHVANAASSENPAIGPITYPGSKEMPSWTWMMVATAATVGAESEDEEGDSEEDD